MKSTLRFTSSGLIGCLYTGAIDLQQFGRLHVVRATDIPFNGRIPEWETSRSETGEMLFSDPSRTECLL